MKQIKFKAWLKKSKEMIGCNRPLEGNTEGLNELLEESEYVVFLQYTGLKDKNGKEIYEGDILTNTWIKKEFICPDNGGAYYRNRPIKTTCVVK